jgi:hypothetical protein
MLLLGKKPIINTTIRKGFKGLINDKTQTQITGILKSRTAFIRE